LCTIFLTLFTFPCYSSVPDLGHAKQLLLYAYTSYCPAENISEWNCYWCGQTQSLQVVGTAFNSSSNAFAFVGYTNTEIVVSIRGTVLTSIKNWIKDLDFFITPLPYAPSGVKVHQGFLSTWTDLKGQVLPLITQALTTSGLSNVVVTGHSLGGAVANLAAVDIWNTFHTRSTISLWTYGSPRVGNSEWVSYFDDFTMYSIRMVNNEDIVPHLPPHFVDDYHHIPDECWYHDSAWEACDMSGEDPNCSDSLKIPISVDDHLNYFGVYLYDGLPYQCVGIGN